VGAGVVGLFVGVVIAPTADAAGGSLRGAAVAVVGTLPASLVGGNGFVYAQPRLDTKTPSRSGKMTPLTRITPVGKTFSASLSTSSLRPFALTGGYVNLAVDLVSGDEMYQHFFSVNLQAARAEPDATGRSLMTGVGRASTVNLGLLQPTRFRPAAGDNSNVDRACDDYSSETTGPETASRIGEFHVANTSSATETFEYNNTFSSSVSVGVENLGANGYSGDGSDTVSQSESSHAGSTQGEGFIHYANDHMYFAVYNYNLPAGCYNPHYLTEAVDTVGDVFPGSNSPGPLGHACTSQRNFATVSGAPGDYGLDKARSDTYKASIGADGFQFTATTGFSSDIYDNYEIGGSGNNKTAYVCGAGDSLVDQSKILYNTPT
jgi:hypothetical protein